MSKAMIIAGKFIYPPCSGPAKIDVELRFQTLQQAVKITRPATRYS